MSKLGYSNTMTFIPENVIKQIDTHRESNPEVFYAMIKGLRENNWSLRKIASDFGVSASGVAVWERKATYTSTGDFPVYTQRLPGVNRKARREKIEIPTSDKKKIAELADKASGVRRFTPEGHPTRVAALELEELLRFHQDRGVTLQQMAEAAGRTRRAIAQRLEKPHGSSSD